jgi:DNA-binding Lrp family transcriptional regulator
VLILLLDAALLGGITIGVSRTTVQNRLDRLEQSGVIAGYTVTLKPEVEKSQIKALMFITAEGKEEGKVIDVLRGFPSIIEIYSTNGHWDLMVEVQTDSLIDFHEVLAQVRVIPGVLTTETTILLAPFKN